MRQSAMGQPGDSSAQFTKQFVIGFAFVEALLIIYMLFSGRSG